MTRNQLRHTPFLRNLLVETQDQYQRRYDGKVLFVVGLEATISRRKKEVRRQAEHAAKQLAKPRAAALQPKASMKAVKAADRAEELTAHNTRFDELVKAITEKKKKVDAAMVKKNEANEDLANANLQAARVFESNFRLVGMEELADRIRPFTYKNKPKRQDDEGDDTGSGDTGEGDDTGSGDTGNTGEGGGDTGNASGNTGEGGGDTSGTGNGSGGSNA